MSIIRKRNQYFQGKNEEYVTSKAQAQRTKRKKYVYFLMCGHLHLSK